MPRKINSIIAVFAAGAFLGVSQAQQPPAPPADSGPSPQTVGAPPPPAPNAPPAPKGSAAPGPPANPGGAGQQTFSRRGTIKSFNTGPNGETNGVILQDGTTVMFPPEFGTQLRSTVKEGSRVTVAGASRPGASGQTVIDAQTITYKGQVMTVPAPAPPPPGGPAVQAGGPPPAGPNAPSRRPRGPGRASRPAPPPPLLAPPPLLRTHRLRDYKDYENDQRQNSQLQRQSKRLLRVVSPQGGSANSANQL